MTISSALFAANGSSRTGSGVLVTTEFRVLGAIEVLADGRAVEVGHARPRAVLAVLLANANRTVPADQLADRVWGQAQAPDDPRGALRTYVSVLRKALAAENGIAFVRQSSGYKAVLDKQHVDLHRFHDLLSQARAAGDDDQAATIMQEALGLWRGEPFTGLDTPWINATRQSLLMQWQAARLDLTDIQLRRGQHAGLLSELIHQADEHPLDERLAGQLMLALYRSGRQADALAHYQRIRARLADEVGTDPGPAVRQLYQQILTADPALAAPVPQLAPRQARPTMPRQLPAAPRLFTGRNRELAWLTETLDKQAGPGATPVISAISGAGGIGKTWLAVRWAHQHADRFPDGQLYVNLRGFDPSGQPMPAEVAVRGFLDALGVAPAVIPAELDAQIGLYRSLLADKRMLILLDNAREAAQVMPLLPGSPTCTIVITSRQKLTGLITAHGARTLDLEMLPEGEARALLARHLGDDRITAEPDAVATLLARCAGLPLALSIIAARAITQPGLPLAMLAHELQDASTRLDALDTSDLTASMHATLSWSYDALTPDAARALDLLALAPGPDISATAAASLTALPLERLRTVLRDLEHVCLLQQHSPGRYRMHDLIRLYATEHAARHHAPTERGEALRRVLAWYLRTADAADRVLAPTRRRVQLGPPSAEGQPLVFGGYEQALAWCDAEHANLVACVQAAAEAGEYEIAWKLPLVLAIFFEVRKPWADWIACSRTGVAAARHAHDPHGEAWALSSLATAYRGLRRFEAALGCLRRSSRIRRETGDLQAEGAALNNIGTVYGDLGQFADAAEHFRLALAIARDTGNRFSEGIALCNLSEAHLKLWRPDAALDLGQQALALARETGYRQVEGLALNNLGAAYSMMRRPRDAYERYQQALDVFQWAGDRHGEAEIRHKLGDLLHGDGDTDHARGHWQRALAIFDELGDARGDEIRSRLEISVPT